MPKTIQDTLQTEEKLQIIPEEVRTTNVATQFWVWSGVHLAPITWVLGSIGINLGLGLWETVAVLALGNLIAALVFGVFILIGQKTGVTGLVLSRSAFGRFGNYLPGLFQFIGGLGWTAIQTWIAVDLTMALLEQINWIDGAQQYTGLKIMLALGFMVLQLALAWGGFKYIAIFEKWTVPPTLLILLFMTIAAWGFIGVDWTYTGDASLTGWDKISRMSTVMTVIGIGWGVTFFTYAADYSRFVSTSVKKSRLYWISIAGQITPVIWLGLLGASLASTHPDTDPGHLIIDSYGVLAIPILLFVLHSPLAKNSFNLYSFSLAAQALDFKWKRSTIVLTAGGFAMIGAIFMIFHTGFVEIASAWMSVLALWISAWTGVVIVDYFVVRKQQLDIDELLQDPKKVKEKVNWNAIFALLFGMFSGWLFMYGDVNWAHGPLSKLTGNLELSWLAGFLGAAGTQLLYHRYSLKTGEQSKKAG